MTHNLLVGLIRVSHRTQEYFTYHGGHQYGDSILGSVWGEPTDIRRLLDNLPTYGRRGSKYELALISLQQYW